MPKTGLQILNKLSEEANSVKRPNNYVKLLNQRWWSEEEIQIAFNKAIMNCDKKENAINLMYDYLLEKN